MQTERIYPLTVVRDRYCGTYSGAMFTAWNLYPHEVPREIDDCDDVCIRFWEGSRILCGKGNTPDKAIAALAAEIENNGGIIRD